MIFYSNLNGSIMSAEWKALDIQKNSLTIDLSEDEDLATIKETIVRPKQVIYWPNFLARKRRSILIFTRFLIRIYTLKQATIAAFRSFIRSPVIQPLCNIRG
jgi:hypothetical protein